MGRKSELGRFGAGHHAAPVTTARLLTFLAVGFLLGGLGGWVFMGTMHAASCGVWVQMLPGRPLLLRCRWVVRHFVGAA